MRQSHLYRAVQECQAEKNYPVEAACKLLHISRASYLRWASGKQSARTMENEKIAEKIEQIHMENPDKGYRRINDDLRHNNHIHVNDKRVLRICRAKGIKSTIKYNNHGCTRRAKNPQYLAENLLDRNFHADKPNEKWLTDVTEFKWYEGIELHKVPVLKEFLRYRDTLALFDNVKANGGVGIPFIISDNGQFSFEWAE